MVLKKEKIRFRISAKDIYKKNKSLVLISGILFLSVILLIIFVNALNESNFTNSSLSENVSIAISNGSSKLNNSNSSITNQTNLIPEKNLSEINTSMNNISENNKSINVTKNISENNSSNKTLEVASEGKFTTMVTQSACATLSSANTVYVLDRNLTTTGNCFVISANNITIDGNGYKITGNGGSSGIYVNTYIINATVKNLTIDYFSNGIYLYYQNYYDVFENITITRSPYGINSYYMPRYNNFTNINITGASNYGIYINRDFTGSRIKNVRISSSNYGIYFGSYSEVSYYNVIEDSSFWKNTNYNLYIASPYYWRNFNLSNNNFTTNHSYGNIYLPGGQTVAYYNNRITPDNLLNEKNFYYNYSISNFVFDENNAPNAGAFYCVSCNNVTFKNQNLTGKNYYGMYIYNSNNVDIKNISADSSYYGLYFQTVTSLTINNSKVLNNSYYGLYTTGGGYHNITNTIATNALSGGYRQGYGFQIYTSDTNLTNVTAFSNSYGLYSGGTNLLVVNSSFYSNDYGVYSYSNTAIESCNISSNSYYGAVLSSYNPCSVNNTIFENNSQYEPTYVWDSYAGLYLSSGGGEGFIVKNSNFTNNGRSLYVSSLKNSNFNDLKITNSNFDAIHLYSEWDGMFYSESPNGNNFTNVNISGTESTHNDFKVTYNSGSAPPILDTSFTNTSIKRYNIGAIGIQLYLKDQNAEIKFNEALTGNGGNLSSDIQLNNHSVFINTTKVGTNKGSNITLYNIPTTFYNPQILRSDSICSGDCENLTSINISTVTFAVLVGGNYSLEDYDIRPPVILLNLPVDTFNTSLSNLSFNFTIYDDFADPLNCSIYIDSTVVARNNSATNTSLVNFNVSNLTGGLHSWNITCFDRRLNSNWSNTRTFYRDIYSPTVTLISYYPNLTDYIDPGTNMTFNATIIDDRVNVSGVILEYYNGTDWLNSTMEYLSSNIYQANLTTLETDKNYTFNIWTNDSFGNSNYSTNQTFLSNWDCTWRIDPEETWQYGGWDQNKFLFNLTINNTGDAEYSINNCTLDFHLTHNLEYGRVYFNDWLNNRVNNYYDISQVPAKETRNITINATFSNQIKEESLIITASEPLEYSSIDSQNTSGTIISTTGGPYLYQKIETEIPAHMYLTPQNVSFGSYLRDIAADGTINTTAYNISFNWSLPYGFLILAGTPNMSFENLSNNSLQYNDINITFNETGLGYLSPQIVSVYIYAQGYNSSNELITHSGNRTLLVQQANITLICYNETDGFCVPNCGYSKDPDCEEPSSSTGGGGGGGGGGNNGREEQSSASFELLSGKQQVFQLPIENKYSDPKEKIKISVSGINSEYIKISPETIDRIDPRSSKNITVTITAPAYFSKGEYKLTFTIVGELNSNKTKEAITERKIVTLNIVELPRGETDLLINESRGLINEMNNSKMVLTEVLSLFEEIKTAYNNLDYISVKNNYEKIKEIKDAAFKSKLIISELNDKITKAELDGISVIETKKLFYTSESAFERGDYSLALSRLNEAKLTFAIETKGEFNLLYLVKNNPLKSGASILGFALFVFTASVIIRLNLYKKKLKTLDEEEKLLLELMKVIQRECFTKNHMSMDEYGQAMIQYETRLSEAIEEKIATEAKIANIMKIKGKKRSLEDERKRLVELVKKIQDDYMNKGTIETRIYENMIKSYSARLAEVEEELTFFDAQEALSENKWSRRLMRSVGLGK